MATGVEVTDDGLQFVTEKSIDETDDFIREIAVGTGNSTPATGDTSLDNEIHRQEAEFNTSGSQYDAVVTVSGGTEVTPGTTIQELGLFTRDGDLVIREVIEGFVIGAGHREEFTMPVDFQR